MLNYPDKLFQSRRRRQKARWLLSRVLQVERAFFNIDMHFFSRDDIEHKIHF